MKNLLIILFLTLTHNLNAQTQWSWQTPQPNGNMLRSARFYNQQTGYICGFSGTVLKTTNAGTNWFNLNTNAAFWMNSLYVFDSLNVICCGDTGRILKTTDGGINWKTIISGAGILLYGIDFVNENTGYVCGAGGVIFKTTNKGENWTNLNSTTGARLNAIDFANSNTGYCGGAGIMLKTTNGGNNWFNTNVTFSFPFAMIQSISLLDSNNIYATIVLDSKLIYSSNGGTNWNYYDTQLPQVYNGIDMPNSISFLNVQTGYLASDFGKVCKTTNGGLNWVQDSTFTFPYSRPNIFFGVYANQNIVYAVGGGGTIIKSTNSGSSYFLQSGRRTRQTDVFFINQDLGFSVGWSGEIWKTTNSGNNWIQKTSNTNRKLQSVFFTNSQTGYIAGDTGLILKTTNSGENWFTQTSGSDRMLIDIYFLNQSTGYICGNNNPILKTTNEGNNWIAITSPIAGDLNKIYFQNENTGFSIEDGSFMRTTNGGISWSINNTFGAKGLCFVNLNTGYAVRGGGQVFKTTNNGLNWSQISSQTGWVFYDVYFENEMKGIGVGTSNSSSYGLIAKTTNGGVNWTQMFVTNNYLFSVDFVNEQTGFIVGDWGNILKTTNGGLTFINENHNEVISAYELKQNYPNPFNPSTNIEFNIPRFGFVKLLVYDITGKEVAVLLNKELNPGEYNIGWDASALPSGVYFYTLKVNPETSSGQGFSQTRKMILLK
ncbi:MAG TPA: YCF48-related protein [Ignavibacteria bacterium]|nr:YCF48-related protein [Ignavibacteria bacterium]